MVREGCLAILIETDSANLQLLTQWLSPSFPLGAFSYSHGLEMAVENGDVVDGAGLAKWIFANIKYGAGRNDGIFLAHAYRSRGVAQLKEIDQLALAFAPSSERLAESTNLGKAFAKTLANVWGDDIKASSYPVVLGAAARNHRLDLSLTIAIYLQSFAANLVSCAQRLLALGQTEGQKIIAELVTFFEELVPQIISASFDDLGGCVFRADMASMEHENQKVRIFRS